MAELVDHQEEIQRIKALKSLPPAPPFPTLPVFNVLSTIEDRLKIIQLFVEQFEYNYSGKPFFKMKKSGGAFHIQSVAKQLIKAGLPIQCVEAVFISTYVSRGMTAVVRIPMSFKSQFIDGVHRHIVNVVYFDGKWGALGISRRDCLMYKPLQFSSLADLIDEFRVSYNSVFHQLLVVYLGLPFPHSFQLDSPIAWRHLKLKIKNKDVRLNDNANKIEKYCKDYVFVPQEGTC